ncbi:PRKCA-binding protein-like protein [Sarcoptes scabiei]|uniref:PRKCA-binding protein n=1 Tax=Sarcoptes scabiei TaxID=52283 RepID=A0A132A0V7_SARSC|nr:PRKCA-binding protein-like protein [Sarcoptes scabiei]
MLMTEDNDDCYLYDEDKMGMRVTSGVVKIKKDVGNLIGISIGGGAPNCPCLYVVQVFENTPASNDGTLEAGDEIISIDGKCIKGSTKVEVAKLIQSIKNEVNIGYNKLHADPKQGKTLDIILKKLKHKMVENMDSTTADALGLSRAILCNDSLVKKLQELNRNEYIFKGLMTHMNYLIRSYIDIVAVYKDFGEIFSEIGAHEPQTDASLAFTKFGNVHRSFEKEGIKLINELKPVLKDLSTYLNKAIPDTRLTIKKYADSKFEYLSYCLKVKEMDDEEYTYNALQEPMYRVETGNYEYRLILRCRQEARKRFANLRSDVLVKLELLDQKHVHNIATQITKFISLISSFVSNCQKHLDENSFVPFELDLSKSCLIDSISNDRMPSVVYEDDDNNNNGDVNQKKNQIINQVAEEAIKILEQNRLTNIAISSEGNEKNGNLDNNLIPLLNDNEEDKINSEDKSKLIEF